MQKISQSHFPPQLGFFSLIPFHSEPESEQKPINDLDARTKTKSDAKSQQSADLRHELDGPHSVLAVVLKHGRLREIEADHGDVLFISVVFGLFESVSLKEFLVIFAEFPHAVNIGGGGESISDVAGQFSILEDPRIIFSKELMSEDRRQRQGFVPQSAQTAHSQILVIAPPKRDDCGRC